MAAAAYQALEATGRQPLRTVHINRDQRSFSAGLCAARCGIVAMHKLTGPPEGDTLGEAFKLSGLFLKALAPLPMWYVVV